MSNEDYLDNLLKQMSVENTDPESAINRVRRAQSYMVEQADDASVETAKTVKETEAEAEAMPDLSAPVFLNSENTSDEAVETFTEEEPVKTEKKTAKKKSSEKAKKEDKSDKKKTKSKKAEDKKTSDKKSTIKNGKKSDTAETAEKDRKKSFEEDKLDSLLEAVVKPKEVPDEVVSVEEVYADDFAQTVDEVILTDELEELQSETESVVDIPADIMDETANVEDAPEEDVFTEDIAELLKEVADAEETPTGTVSEEAPTEEAPTEEMPTEEIPEEEIPEEEIPEEEIPMEEEITEEPKDETLTEDLGDLDIGALLGAVDKELSSNEETLEESDLSQVEIDDLLNAAENGEEVGENLDSSDIDALLADLSEPTETEKLADKDETLNLSEEEVNKMLESASADSKSEPEGELEIDLSDLDSLESLGIYDKNDIDKAANGEGTASDSEELSEISDLLKSIDSNEVAESSDDNDMLKLLNDAVSEQEAEEAKIAEAEAYKENEERDRKNGKTKKESGKKGKLKKKEATEGEDVKPSLWKRILEFLTASEDEEEEDLLKPSDAPSEGREGATEAKPGEFEDVKGENKEILDEMDKEGEDGKKKKKKKKKKGKGTETAESEDTEGEEDGEAAPKKKKEKKPRIPLILDIDTGKPLSKKNVRLIGVLAASLLIVIIIFAKSIPNLIVNGQARKAYYKNDYETVYRVFYGEKLSESDQLMFDRAELILKVNHKYEAFAAYNKIGMKAEALDQLLQAVTTFDEWLITSEIIDNEEEFRKAYNRILSALQINYDLTEEEAREINALETDLEYSLMVESVVNGTPYIDPNEPLPEPFVPPAADSYKDVLPEEE